MPGRSARAPYRALSFALFPLLAACGSSSGDTPQSTAPSTTATTEAWTTLLTGDWTRDPGTEGYTCVRKTVDRDYFVDAFEAINPVGTHHTLLTMGTANGPDGETACSAADNYLLSVFGSGVGTSVIVKLPGAS